MVRSSLRRLTGGALTLAILTGCSSRSPFTDTFDAERPRHPQSMRADASTRSASRSAEFAPPPVLDADSRLEDYLRYAALENPGLEGMFQEWKAAVERLPQVSALPDPQFTYGYYVGEVETRVGPMQHSLSLSQTFPWFGKLQDRENAAARYANAAYERFEAARLALFLQVERAYNERLQRVLDSRVWARVGESWYKNEAGRITNNWSGSTLEYWWRTRHADVANYHVVGVEVATDDGTSGDESAERSGARRAA